VAQLQGDFTGCLDFARHDKRVDDGNSFVKRPAFLYWLIGIVIVAVVVGAAFHFDNAVHDFLLQYQTKTMRKVMRAVSRIGDWPAHVAAGLILAGFAWWRGSKKWTRVFLSMLIALAVSGVVARGIKIAAARARPSVKTEEVSSRSRFSSKYHAFPSGHVAASTAFFGVLFFASRRIGLGCLPIPILIGFSRMYVGAHYLSDVVCAALLGMLIALVIGRLLLESVRDPQSAIRD
jgi:membrane-associated phospholipid phosphatase